MAVATNGPSHYAVHWEHPLDVPFIVHDLPFREPMPQGDIWLIDNKLLIIKAIQKGSGGGTGPGSYLSDADRIAMSGGRLPYSPASTVLQAASPS